ncbi:MAG: hypothetical protein JO201_02135 [Verrucomicrobia bacterium]|nr:hypothetical protein [Verrucomicrobiota bacterium]
MLSSDVVSTFVVAATRVNAAAAAKNALLAVKRRYETTRFLFIFMEFFGLEAGVGLMVRSCPILAYVVKNNFAFSKKSRKPFTCTYQIAAENPPNAKVFAWNESFKKIGY